MSLRDKVDMAITTATSDLDLVQIGPWQLEYRENRNARSVVAAVFIVAMMGPLAWMMTNAISEFTDDPWSGGSIPQSVPLAYIAVEFACLFLLQLGGAILAIAVAFYILFGRH